MNQLNNELAVYSIALTTYEGTHRLPPHIFSQPDHLALRTADINEFEHVVRSLNNNVEQMTCVEEPDGRFKVAAKMLGTVSLGIYGKVKWLEVIEDEESGIDHTEFFFPDFSRLRECFHRGQVDYEIDDSNGSRVADVAFRLRDRDFRFKVTDTPVEAIVAREIDDGEAYILAA